MTIARPLLWLILATTLAACAGGGNTTGAGGTTGAAGTTGSAGTTGGAGMTGGAGTTGGAGMTGNAGTTGTAGTTGSAGLTGSAGIAGGAGTTGSAGINAGGSGGTTDAPGSGGAAGTAGGGPCSAPGLILCDDFESRPVGMKPMGAPWATSQCFASGFTLQVDGAQHYSGSRSLASQGVPYGDCMLHAEIGPASDFWVRARIRFAQGGTDQFSAHEVTAFELTPTMSVDDPGIRVGFRGDNSCMPTGVEVNITGGEEKTGCTGFQLQADSWYCFELHVVRDAGNTTTADLWINGADQSFNIHGTPATTVVNPNPGVWRYLRLGTRSYSNAYPAAIHVDDIAVGTQRIGCN